jgi:hypothetical protein
MLTAEGISTHERSRYQFTYPENESVFNKRQRYFKQMRKLKS